MNQLAPSILAADFNRLGEEIKAVERAGIKMLHIDVMDGVFVPSISFGMPLIKSIRKETELFFDVHLMITEPERYIDEFCRCGADLLMVHVEACPEPEKTLKKIHAAGMKAGLAINPETPIEKLYSCVHEADMFLVMTVHPGFGGQRFMVETLDKIRNLRHVLEKENPGAAIEVDGGIYPENVKLPLEAGANVIVAGTAVFSGDIKKNVMELMQKIQ